ncbi:RNA-directed DNA polymerase, eukaryota, reverse transcriptase zinc-binding domain protein, partial [Tanacetum coccineum]
YSKRACILTKLAENILESFKVIVQGKVFWVRAKEVCGWTPDFVEEEENESEYDDVVSKEGDQETNGGFTPPFVAEDKSNNMNSSGNVNENGPVYAQEVRISSSAKEKKTSDTRNDEIDKLVCSGGSILQVMEDMVKALPKRLKKIGLRSYALGISPSVGNSGGILCVWDLRVFHKDNSTVSDYFVMVRGEWIQNGKIILIISIYAPQELNEKKMLWDCLSLVISNWQGDVIIMGDFNEVRKQEERYGSMFNILGADAFNLFISNAGLEEIQLEGFDEFVKNTWKDAQVTDQNAMRKFLKKLKFLKGKIREWTKVKRVNAINHKTELKEQLAEIDILIDKGEDNPEIINNRYFIFKSLQDINKLESMEVAQKAKIKWGIEGDENSKYYHGTLNKQRNQLAIRGVLIDGTWTESPNLAKDEFFSHFQNYFGHPYGQRFQLEMEFPIQLSSEQKEDMECNITRKEIKRAIWDCGTDKSTGPYGFTFGFYKRFWCLIENDVVEAVNTFFQNVAFPKGSNASFIALIPKTHNANMVKDFWPITLIGSLYKIIAKILANRLMSVLGDIANEASGLRINMNKSKLIGLSVDNDKVVQAVAKIGCASIKTPFWYLGTKVGGLMSRIKSWDEIVNKFGSRLSKWKLKSLSIGGRMTLNKSVLGSLSIYHMPIYKVPKKVLNRLESIRCHFFNGIDPLSKKPI